MANVIFLAPVLSVWDSIVRSPETVKPVKPLPVIERPVPVNAVNGPAGTSSLDGRSRGVQLEVDLGARDLDQAKRERGPHRDVRGDAAVREQQGSADAGERVAGEAQRAVRE
jgi:hypothetical protein